MISAKVTKNGMINLPVEVRKKLNISPGDEISFLESENGYIIIPIKNILDLTNPDELPIAKEIIEEIRKERQEEATK